MKSSTRKTLHLIIVILVSVFQWGGVSFGYERATHRLINNAVSDTSVMDEYFSAELSRPVDARGRIADTYQGKSPYKLFEDAGDAEDGWPFYFRAWNHYHDPIRAWGQAGYTGFSSGISSILWAQGALSSNTWTWGNALSFYLGGLTAKDNSTRNQNLANLFTALGHLTHLVADVSVPEHSRNDAHLLRNYESWCLDRLEKLESIASGRPAFRYEFAPDDAIFAQGQGSGIFGSGPLSPISNLWDTTVAEGTYNPNLGGHENLVGLAEYSNYNYFSGDTVFSGYDYPSRGDAALYATMIQIPAPDGLLDNVIYYRGQTSEGIPIPHLAATDLLFQEWDQVWGQKQISAAGHLDDYCWEDYASNLVPRAVSYGTALVDYFFRGKFDVSGSGSTLTVTNRSSGTAAGTFAVYRDDPSDGLRKPVPGLENLAAAGLRSGSSTTYTAVGFSPPSSTDNLLLVFTGTIANEGAAPNEDNAVAGKAFSWTSPQATYPVAWRPAPPTFSLPAGPRSHGDYWPPGCYDCHYFLSPLPHYLRKDMTNLELCKSCHGMTAAANASLWDDARNGWPPPRTLVAPEGAPPEWKVAGVATFNPRNNDLVSGLVQFLPALFDGVMDYGVDSSPMHYRVEVYTPDDVLVTNYPAGLRTDFATGWQPATAFLFLRNWTYPEALLWDSTSVPNGTYRFFFIPMSYRWFDWNALETPVPSSTPIIGSPAVLHLTVKN